MHVCVCVRVLVCARESERERLHLVESLHASLNGRRRRTVGGGGPKAAAHPRPSLNCFTTPDTKH